MKAAFYRSPAVFVLETTEIGECVQLMRDHNVSSLLVVDSTKKQGLSGIFTERDLLKTVRHSADGSYWKTPIKEVMSKPVKVIEASRLAEAGELMVKFGLRHLPIVVNDKKTGFQIVGMLSMKDLLVNLLKNRSQEAFQKALYPKIDKIAHNSIAVVTADPYLLRLLEEGFPESASIEIRHLAIDDLMANKGVKASTEHLNAAIVDLDNLKSDRWEALLLELTRAPQSLPVIVTFTSGQHDPVAIKALGEFAKAKGLSIFLKPVPVAALFARIVKALR